MKESIRKAGGVAGNKIEDAAMSGMDKLNKAIQTGPGGLSFMCWGCSIGLIFAGIRGFIYMDTSHGIPLKNILLDTYLIMLGMTAFLLESDIDFLRKIPVLKSLTPHIAAYQEKVNNYALFLTNLQGRGLFYIFVGTLCLEEGEFIFSIRFYIGLLSGFVGVLCILFSFGIKPDIGSESYRKGKDRAMNVMRQNEYQQVDTDAM